MTFNEYIPSPPLRPYIHRYWIVETYPDDLYPMEHVLMPNGMDGIICLYHTQAPQTFTRNNIHHILPENYALIQPVSHWMLHIPAICGIAGVFFKPAVLHRLLRYPMYELANQPVDLEAVLGRDIIQLNEQLRESPDKRIQVLEAFFMKRLPVFSHAADHCTDHAIRQLLQQNGGQPIQLLTDQLQVSRQYLARQFADKVGISPKHFARVVRFNALHRLIAGKEQADWFDIIYQFGYHDQAHLVKDFHDFTGWSPTEYLHAYTEAADFYAGKHR